ncbi:desulfoferrodoxin FeS4 iron-binding domain-containing protein [bacterium]|nr:desulfoferrodoxin FeS4 iron-binding domain-containing protein [bacterium]
MKELLDTYKCSVCGNVIELTHSGFGDLVCCGESMDFLKEKEPEENDPHRAHIEYIDEFKKRVFFNHPMSEEHHIEYIEAISYDKVWTKRKFLKPEEKAEMTFACSCKEGFYIRLYCNRDDVYTTKF